MLRMDFAGAVLLGSFLVCLLVPLTFASQWGWTRAATVTLLSLSAASLAGFIAVELRATNPVLDLTLLVRNRLIESRLTPNAISLTGLALCVVASAFVTQRWFIPAGIAFIVGSIMDTLDAFLGQGFAVARDRLWQIDTWRKRGLGRLAADRHEQRPGTDRTAVITDRTHAGRRLRPRTRRQPVAAGDAAEVIPRKP